MNRGIFILVPGSFCPKEQSANVSSGQMFAPSEKKRLWLFFYPVLNLPVEKTGFSAQLFSRCYRHLPVEVGLKTQQKPLWFVPCKERQNLSYYFIYEP